MKQTIAIAFSGGSYGTYLEWCLTSLTSTAPLFSPFTKSGNSHEFIGVHLADIDGWRKFVKSSREPLFARFHPKTRKEHSLSENLDYVCSTTRSLIHLYPARNRILLSLNNQLTKISTNWWDAQTSSDIDIFKIYQNWPIAPTTPPSKIPPWVKREFLSFYLMPAWMDQVEWYHPDTWSHVKACVITVDDLLFNFETSLTKIQQHCGLNFVRPISDLLPYHQENLKLQYYLQQDQLCKDIVDSTVNNVNLDWQALPLGSEVWVQWELRNRGFEIQCDGLDTFPTNSIQLKELLYSV